MKTEIKLEILTPIFIGSGDEYYPQDFFIDDNENLLCFIDREKFIESIEKRGLFDKFLEVSGDIKKLLRFIDDNFTKDIAKDVVKADYKIIDELFETSSRPVKGFIKDKFDFKPYIPGSTLKGIIRTAILDYKIEQFKEQETISKLLEDIKKIQCNQKQLSNLYRRLETVIFCNSDKYDAKKDILKALYTEDLKPNDYKLKVIKPKNRPYNKIKDNQIPVILESLIDGEFRGEIRVDENLLKDANLRDNTFFKKEPMNIDLIKKSLKHFYSKIINKEADRFKAETPKYQEFLIKIGQHSGAGSKSLNDFRHIYIKQIKKCFDYQLSVWIDIDDNPLGWAKLTFEK